jgi:carbon storage regulator
VLVLARKPNQSIMIGDDIEVRIVDVKGDQVKIGITAPKNIRVDRKEIYDMIKTENIESVKAVDKVKLKDIGDIFKNRKK